MQYDTCALIGVSVEVEQCDLPLVAVDDGITWLALLHMYIIALPVNRLLLRTPVARCCSSAAAVDLNLDSRLAIGVTNVHCLHVDKTLSSIDVILKFLLHFCTSKYSALC